MDQTLKEVVAAVREAIDAEVDGYHFYKMAARSTDDEKGRQVFEMLAEDEENHANFLRAQFEALNLTGQVDPDATLPPLRRLEGDHPIFTPGLKERAKRPNYEITALSVGAQLELSAIQFYQNAANAASDPDVKAFFEDLAGWEKGHYDALNRQLENLRADHWDTSRFSPF